MWLSPSLAWNIGERVLPSPLPGDESRVLSATAWRGGGLCLRGHGRRVALRRRGLPARCPLPAHGPTGRERRLGECHGLRRGDGRGAPQVADRDDEPGQQDRRRGDDQRPDDPGRPGQRLVPEGLPVPVQALRRRGPHGNPLSSPPPLEPGAGHSPPQENQSATPHTISAPVATTTANPTVGPSNRLGLALLTAAKIRPVARRKRGGAPAEAASSVKSL